MMSASSLPPAYCLERVSRPWHKEGELRHIPEDSLSRGDGTESERDQGSKSLQETELERRALHRKRTPEMFRGSH